MRTKKSGLCPEEFTVYISKGGKIIEGTEERERKIEARVTGEEYR